MELKASRAIYFSPTKTTKKIIESIAEGIGFSEYRQTDLSYPEYDTQPDLSSEEEIVIIGAPVYGGRIPVTMKLRFQGIKGSNCLAVLVVVYGNRAFEDALRELYDMAVGAGFRPVAMAAFIGEHSYSTNCQPIAQGRPDDLDIRKALKFGSDLREKIQEKHLLQWPGAESVPGNSPYKEWKLPADVAPDTDQALCSRCMLCVSHCPVGAISVLDPVMTDNKKCIACCACIKICPVAARKLKNDALIQTSNRLFSKCQERKEPVIFMDNTIKEVLERNGFEKYGIVPVSDFAFHRSFYDICATNQCGKYNTNWSCPPGVGAYEDLVGRVKEFQQALVVQSVWTIADSFDIEGMLESGQKHNAMLRSLVDELYPLLGEQDKMTMSAGACELCEECRYIHGSPCPMPERAFAALEAHGVDVTALVERCGLKYNNGPNTVSYVGVILF